MVIGIKNFMMVMNVNKEKGNEMNKENIMKNLDCFLIPENSLYQWLEKKHLDPDNKLSDEKWEEFVDNNIDLFADNVSQVGKEMMSEYIFERGIK